MQMGVLELGGLEEEVSEAKLGAAHPSKAHCPSPRPCGDALL